MKSITVDDDYKAVANSTAVDVAFLTEIGRITVHFALLERDIVELTHHLLGVPESSARCVTSELSFRGVTQLAASLMRERSPEELEAFRQLLKRVGQCEAKRNVIVHSLYGSAWDSNLRRPTVIRTKYSAKQTKGLSFQREEMTTNDLYAIAREIAIVTYEVETFRRRIGSSAP
jgi:hypothetical protein